MTTIEIRHLTRRALPGGLLALPHERRTAPARAADPQHAHPPHCRTALYRRGPADRRGRPRRRRGRDARRLAVGPHAHGRRAVRAPPASHGLHRERRGCGRPRRAEPRCLRGARARLPLSRAHGLPLARQGARRRRGRPALRGVGAHRARRQVHHGRERAVAPALRAAGREPLLGIDHLRGGRGAPLRQGAAAPGGHGLHQLRRRRRAGALPRARRHRRGVSRAGEVARAHRVLRR